MRKDKIIIRLIYEYPLQRRMNTNIVEETIHKERTKSKTEKSHLEINLEC